MSDDEGRAAAAAAAAALLAEAEATARGLLDAAVLAAEEVARTAARDLLAEARLNAGEVLATAISVAASLRENTVALSAIEAALIGQNAYLHHRVHDLATMITVLQVALALLWERAGFEAELGPLELHGLVPIDEPPVEP